LKSVFQYLQKFSCCSGFFHSSGTLCPYDFRAFFSFFVKKVIEILVRIILNLYIIFGYMTTLTILILPNHRCGKTFHVVVTSTISFFSAL
jgi:hypothetical protein